MTKKLLIGADILMALVTGLRFRYLPQEIPLFYSRPWGDAQLADWWYILMLPMMMHIMYFLNGYVGKRFFSEDAVSQKIIFVVNTLMIVILTLIYTRIILLIT